MPSASNVKRVPQALIHGYDSRNWNRGPFTWNVTYITAVSPRIASDQASATVLASPGFVFGSRATTSAPIRGAPVSTLRNGKELIRMSPPALPLPR
jgi:hypothetical protein